MREKNRLCVLQVRHPRERDTHGLFGERRQRGYERNRGFRDFLRSILNEHAEIGSHKLIPAPRGMQLVAKRAQLFYQRRFYEMVNVFRWRDIEPAGIRFSLLADGVERRECLFHLRSAEDSDLS